VEKCDAMVDVGRRRFLTGATLGAAGVAAATMLPRAAEAATPSQGSALVTYPANRLGNVQDLVLNKVPGGVGPDQDIVGFSTTCPHKGFPLAYNSGDKTLNCPGHYSRFDCERGGQQVWGHATQNLPQYVLRVDDKGDIYAEGVDELLYGRLSNVL